MVDLECETEIYMVRMWLLSTSGYQAKRIEKLMSSVSSYISRSNLFYHQK